jgi:hypothetical protein
MSYKPKPKSNLPQKKSQPEKVQPSQSQSQPAESSTFGEHSEAPLPTVPVEVKVEQHAEPAPTSLLDRAKAKLVEPYQEGASDNTAATTDKPKKDWRRYSKKYRNDYKQESSKTELATLVSTILILVLATWPAPDEVKPNSTEVDAFSEHLSSIIVRHIDISGAITGDILDAVGLLAVIGSWLTRVGPQLRTLNEENAKVKSLGLTPTHTQKGKVVAEVKEAPSKTPIENLSPATKEYLDKLAAENDNSN